ncbi:hypothetical protein ACN28S_23090 [Cystobacter fuscus]
MSISKLIIAGLALLLLSCGSTRHVAPSSEELTGFVLIIEEASDDQVHHSWQRAAEFDLSRYDNLSSHESTIGSIVLAASRPRDCDQEQIDCHRDCMKNRLPSKLSHIKRDNGAKNRYCSETCLFEYMDCLRLQELNALEFSTANGAAEWLKRNRKELLVGSIVIIAGVAFVTLSAGAGLVVLAPVVLVAG